MDSVTGQAQHEISDLVASCGHDAGPYPIQLGGGIKICNKCFKEEARSIALSEYKDIKTSLRSA